MSQYRFLGLAVVVSLGLAGCMEGNNATSGARSGTAFSSGPVERDIEDPRIFSKRENGLWDGRPSLGGVWVAHPDVRSPERVIIRNTENGQETIGALFRRERMNPGPAFQVSGEAANGIGMLAGAPTMIEVVALRVEDPQPATPEAVAEPEPADAPAAAPETPEPAPRAAETDPPAPDTRPEAERPIAMPESAPETRPAREGGLLGRIFGRRSADPTPAMDPDGIATQVLDGAEAAPAATLAPETPQAAPTPPPAQASALAQPYIQLGIFSVEANAGNAERMARGAGLNARVIPGRASGNQFWRVVVGPAATQAEQRQMLARVKGLGFNDAYAVRR